MAKGITLISTLVGAEVSTHEGGDVIIEGVVLDGFDYWGIYDPPSPL